MNDTCSEMEVMVWIPHIRDSLEVVYSVFLHSPASCLDSCRIKSCTRITFAILITSTDALSLIWTQLNRCERITWNGLQCWFVSESNSWHFQKISYKMCEYKSFFLTQNKGRRRMLKMFSLQKCTITTHPEAGFLDVIGTKVLRVFLRAFHSHLY